MTVIRTHVGVDKRSRNTEVDNEFIRIKSEFLCVQILVRVRVRGFDFSQVQFNSSSRTLMDIRPTLIGKVGCIFPMVILSEFRLVKYRDDDHQEDASYFINLREVKIVDKYLHVS